MVQRKHHKSKSKNKVTVTTIARRVCRNRFTDVANLLPHALELDEDNSEAVHDLRVATRRAAAAIDLYASWLPAHGCKWLHEQFEKIRTALGDARDLDVLLHRIAADARDLPGDVFVWQVRRIALLRSAAQEPLANCARRLKKKKFKKRGLMILSRPRWREKGREPTASEHAARALTKLVKELTKLQKKLGRQSRKLHEVRVLLKRIRYTLELVDEVVSSPLAKSTQQRLTDLQDRLGRANDDAVMFGQLQDWAEECRNPVLEKSMWKFAERAEHRAAETLTPLAEDLPRELAELVTMLKQLVPADEK